MVSFQAPFLELNQRTTTKGSEIETTSKKRKWHSSDADQDILPFKHCKSPKGATATATTTATAAPKSLSLIQLHLETPLPSEWQRCLDIQSGEIHFYNTRTHKRTLRDPRSSPEPSSPPREGHMSLDLELNLPCGSLNSNSSSITSEKSTSPTGTTKKKSSNSPPPLSTDLFMGLGSVEEKNDDAPEQAVEMVATACMRCHMLVMLCKASPTCPNCKFMHPPYQSSPDLFKSRLRLSC